MSGRATPVLMTSLAAGYVVCAQLGAHTRFAWLCALAVAMLALAALLPALTRGSAIAIVVAFAVLVLIALAVMAGAPRLPGYFVPPLLLAAVAWFFARTLAPSSRPLIARIVQALDGEEFAAQPVVARYAYRLTLFWAVLLSVLALGALVLAFCVVPDGVLAMAGQSTALSLSPAQWSHWVNLGGYGSVAVAFAGEFALRQMILPQAPKRSFVDFARRVATLWPELRQP